MLSFSVVLSALPAIIVRQFIQKPMLRGNVCNVDMQFYTRQQSVQRIKFHVILFALRIL